MVIMLNKERKRQGQKIDILCNDFIAAQRSFINRLDTIAFAANFYESIIGITDLNTLLNNARSHIRQEIADADVTFFLRNKSDFESHIFENEPKTATESKHLLECITDNVAENIRRANKVCTLEDMLAIGLQGNPNELGNISPVAIPLGRLGPSLGFILICRSSENKLTDREINNICAITSGLSQAVQSCQTLLHSAD